MLRRLILLVSALGLGLGGATVVSPAAAEVATSPVFTTTVTDIDASTPGRVRGTITTDAQELQVFAVNDYNIHYTDSLFLKDFPGGSFTFDLETWGLNTGEIQFWACGTGWTQCSYVTDTYYFTATDLAPTSVSWPDDVTIGEEPYRVAATDHPDGGGHLWVSTATQAVRDEWGNPGLPPGSTLVAPAGRPAIVGLPADGPTTLNLLRCNRDEAPTACRPTGLSRAISVDRQVRIQSVQRVAQYVSASASFTLNLEAGEPDHPEHAGPIDLDWEVVGPQMVVAASGHAAGLTLTGRAVKVSIDTSSLPEAAYYVRWTARATNDAYGTVETANQEFIGFIVDHTPLPTPKLTASTTSVYPVQDRYRDYVVLRSTPGYVDGTVRVEIRDATGVTVLRTLPRTSQAAGDAYSEYIWRGNRADGSLYPAGAYQTRVVHTDQAGNVATATGPTITIVRKHLESRVFRKTVTAAGSKVAQYVGRCSRLRSPSIHGWSGSLGLYSNTRCRDGATASTVRTTHRMALPAAVEYSNPVIKVYGGSPRLSPSDVAALLARVGPGTWEWLTEAQSPVEWHGGMASPKAVARDRTITWALRVRGGRHWDARSFFVRVPYRVLVNDLIS